MCCVSPLTTYAHTHAYTQVAVPEITGQLDSWAFDVVMDVIQNILLVPLPDVSGLAGSGVLPGMTSGQYCWLCPSTGR